MTVSRACATANQSIADAANLIERGYADVVVAGGAESLTHIPITIKQSFCREAHRRSPKRSRVKARDFGTLARIRPKDLVPNFPQIAEPTTGESMGESAERMAKENGITRADQDAWALRSHQLAAAGTQDGRLTAEIGPVYVPAMVSRPCWRPTTASGPTPVKKALAKLRPVFDRQHGSVTAGNASPLTDGGSAVIMMSEERAKADGLEPMGFVRSYAFSGLDPGGQLLQGPAYAAPIALDRAGITMADIGLMEMHEAFAAQVLSNLQALSSQKFAEEESGTKPSRGPPGRRRHQRDGRLHRDRPPVRCDRRPPHDNAPERDEAPGCGAGADHGVRGGGARVRDGGGAGVSAPC